MTNDIIGNHVVGMELGMWAPGTYDGRQDARGKVCPQFTPFGIVRHNVNHDNARFGIYVDHQFPRNVQRDDNGFVIRNAKGERPSCDEFTENGEDNGKASVIEDQLEWHNLYVGGYEV